MKKNLKELIEMFIAENLEQRRFDVRKASRYAIELMGADYGGPASCSGFIPFLQARGVDTPVVEHLDRKRTSAYQEYLAMYFGAARLASARQALRAFWNWCDRNGFLPESVERPVSRLPRELSQRKFHWSFIGGP